MSLWSWESSPQYLAQIGHFLGGALFVFALGVLFGVADYAAFAGVGLAAIKEFALDVAKPPWGEGDSWSDSAMDFAFYVLGIGAGSGLYLWAVVRHVLAS